MAAGEELELLVRVAAEVGGLSQVTEGVDGLLSSLEGLRGAVTPSGGNILDALRGQIPPLLSEIAELNAEMAGTVDVSGEVAAAQTRVAAALKEVLSQIAATEGVTASETAVINEAVVAWDRYEAARRAAGSSFNASAAEASAAGLRAEGAAAEATATDYQRLNAAKAEAQAAQDRAITSGALRPLDQSPPFAQQSVFNDRQQHNLENDLIAAELSREYREGHIAAGYDPIQRIQDQIQATRIGLNQALHPLDRSGNPREPTESDDKRALTARAQLAGQYQRLAKAVEEEAANYEDLRKGPPPTIAQTQAVLNEKVAARTEGVEDPRVRASALSQVLAEEKYAGVLNSGTATLAELGTAERAMTLATIRNTETLNRVRAEQAGAGAPPRGPFGNFVAGAFGGGNQGFDSGTLSGQLGATFKYIAFYEAFILLVRGAEQAVRANAEYQRSVTNLSIAMNTNREDAARLADEYGAVGTAVGLSADKTVNAATEYIRAFPGQPGAGQIGANTAAQLSVLGDPKELERNLLDVRAVTKAFGLEVNGASRVMDAATVSSQGFGFALASDVLPGVAQLADQAREAGFSLEQTTSLIAAVQSQTGETSEAVAGNIKRIFGREGQNTFQQEFQARGVDTTQTLAKQFEEFVPKFEALDEATRIKVAGRIGGTRGGPDVIALFDSYAKILQVADQALNSQGATQDQVNKKMADMLGLLQQIGGSFKALAKDIGASGLLDIFGVALQLLKPIIDGVDGIAKAFSAIPAHDLLITLGEIAAVVAVIRNGLAATAAGNVAAAVGRVATKVGILGVASTGGEVAAGAAAEREAVARNATAAAAERAAVAEGTVAAASERAAVAEGEHAAGAQVAAGAEAEAAGASGLGAVTKAGGFMKGLGPAAIVATVGLYALGELKDQSDKLNQAMATAAAGLAGFQTAPLTVEGIQGRIDTLYTARGELDTSWKDTVFNGGQGKELGTEIDAQIAYLKTLLANAKAGEGAPGQPKAFASYYGSTGTDFVGALQAMKDHTIPATLAVALFSQAVGEAGDTAVRAKGQFLVGGSFVGDVSRAAVSDTTASRIRSDLTDPRFATKLGGTPNPQLQFNLQEQIGKNVNDYIDANHLQGKPLSAAQKQEIGQHASAVVIDWLKPLIKDPAELGAIADLAYKDAIAWVNGQQSAAVKVRAGKLDTNAVAELIQAGPDIVNTLLQQITQLSDPAKRLHLSEIVRDGAAKAVADARAAGVGAEGLAPLLVGLDAANVQVAEIAVANGKQLIDHIKATHRDNKASRAAITKVATEMVKEVAATGDVDATIQAMQGLSAAGVTAIVNNLKAIAAEVYASYLAYLAVARAADVAAAGESHGGADYATNTQTANQDPKVAAAKKKADAAKQAADTAAAAALHAAPDKSYYSGFGSGLPDTKKATGDTAAQIAAARAEAAAIPGDELSQARAAVAAARINLDAAKRGSVEYWNDVKALREAQYQLATVEQKLSNESYLLGHDFTNPVVQAQAKVLADLRKLAYDRSRGANTIDDRLTLGQDQAALERTKFDQKLQDAQTNYELGRTSYAAYIRYLDGQHNYLEAIKHRTYQQQQELNQVDQALKAAQNALQGQFNIGDIRVPTPYEVRRYITAQAAGTTYQGSQQTNYITIDGTDTALVQQVLEKLLGPLASQTRTTVGRKN